MKRFYTDPNGNEYPLYEAPYDTAFTVYRSDKNRATIGDPHDCLLARGLRRAPDVVDAFIGSGKDAYVVYKGKGKKPAYALHFTINAEAGRVRDAFESNSELKTQIIILSAPSAARTLAARSRLNKRRYQEVKNGSPVKKRGTQQRTRITRIGVPHRPRAQIVKGAVTLGMAEEATI